MAGSEPSSSGSEYELSVETIQQDLAQALGQLVDPQTAFACSDLLPVAPNPGLIIDGLGIIGLPLSGREAQVVIAKCRKSPVGKGRETLLDDKIRKSWELDPSNFRISNQAAWNGCMNDVVTYIHTKLGVSGPRNSVHAELYKLLIYEEGAFFKPHKDTEKTKGMFGTLAVSLPSKHTGGELVLSHNKDQYRYASAFCSDMVSGTSFSAWYSSVTHEVKPVLSGYRVVLIYNLVQKSAANKPEPYTLGSAEANLKRCLSAWERWCENGNHDLPYIIHKLDYDYSDYGLSLSSLNGNDFVQVSCLQKLCQVLDFGMYFAVHEKVLHKDDEAGDEVFDREESFKDLMSMDGAAVSARPEYCRNYYLSEPDDTDDEDPDDEEHEGWTGNEGAPAQYWYRSVVLLLVPPSCNISFSFSSKGNERYHAILQALPALRKKASCGDESALKSLKQYCSVALAANPPAIERSYSYSSLHQESSSSVQRKNCLEHVAEISLENGWIDMFERIPFDQTRATSTLRAIGRAFAMNSSTRTRLPTMVSGILRTNSIAEKYRIWQSIEAAFRDASADVKSQEDFQTWRFRVFGQISKPTHHYSRADCVALASLAESGGEEMLGTLVNNLQRDDEVALSVFMAEVSRSDHGLQQLKALPSFGLALEAIWENFSFLFRAVVGDRSRFSKPIRNDEGMSSQDICDLLRITDQGKHDLIPMALESMKDAAKDVTTHYLSNELLSFVKAVLKHEIPSLIPDDNFEVAESISELILSILVIYIRQTVPEEPVKPGDWSLPYRGCHRCDDCKQVDKFMADPGQTKVEIRVNEQRRRHLEFEYEGRSHGEKDFSTRTVKDKTPYAWVCEKAHKRYNKLAADRRSKMKEVRLTLNDIGGKKHMALRAYLGENYDAVVSCQPENLPSPKEAEEDQPLAEVGDSALNSRKRKVDVVEGTADNFSRAKRRRETREQALNAEDIVDLT